MLSLTVLVYFAITVSVLLYVYGKWKYSYWKKIGIHYIEPEFFFGNIKPLVKKELCYGEQFDVFYKHFKSKKLFGGGFYNLFTPVFMPTDLKLVKCILHKDFSYFPNHGAYVNEEKDPLTGNLFFLENEKWKQLRAKLTPTFTSGKMKIMFPTILECTNPMVEILNTLATSQEPLEVKELMLRFAKDVIGSIAFGVDFNTLKDSKSAFNEYTKRFFKLDVIRLLNISMGQLLPRDVLSKMGYRFIPKYIEDFFLNLVKRTIDQRETNKIFRNDFLQLLIDLKNNKESNKLNEQTFNHYPEFTINDIAANCFIFFIAGVETTANTISFCLMELALNQDIQEKVRREVYDVVNNHHGEITYDGLMEMKYLEQVICETLRKHPTAQKFHRECIKPYQIPGTDIILEAGTRVVVPVYSIHRDPEYFPHPDKFDPERFAPENRGAMDSACFLGFGEGPRYCIGVRMGKMQTKIALARVIVNFKVTINEKMTLPIQHGFSIVGAAIKGGVWLNVEKI